MFAGTVSRLQWRPSKADYTTDGHDATGALLRHVRQHLLGDGHRAQEVEIHQGLIHIKVGLNAQRALAAAAVVN